MAVDVIIDPLTGQIYWNDSQGTAQSIAISGNGSDLIKTVGYSLQFTASPQGTITSGSTTTTVTGSGTNFLTLFGSGSAGSGAVLYTPEGTSIGTVSTVASDTSLTLQANASASYSGITFRYVPPSGTDRLIFSDSATPLYPATTGANLGTTSYRWALYASTGDFSGALSITDSTNASSTTTGALKITGGIGAQGTSYFNDLYVSGSNLIASSATTVTLGTTASGTTTLNSPTINIAANAPTISASTTGTLTLFDTNVTTVNAFGAATNIIIGTTASSTTNIRSFRVDLGPNSTGGSLINLNAQSIQSLLASINVFTTTTNTFTLFTAASSVSFLHRTNGTAVYNFGTTAAITSTTATSTLNIFTHTGAAPKEINVGTLGTGSVAIVMGTTTGTSNITLNGTVSLSSALAVGSGGTGQTTYTDGQLLIGNSIGNTLTKATLTAGTNISITNGTGSITISATGGGSGTINSGAAGKIAYYPSLGTTVDDATALDYSASSPHLTITSQSTTSIALKLTGIASQSVNLFEIATSGGNILTVGSTGIVSISTTTASNATTAGALVVTGGIGVGSTSYLSDLYVTGVNLIASSATTVTIGTTASGTTTLNSPTINIAANAPTISASTTGTLTLFNSNVTTVNAFGAATVITLGTTATSTTNIQSPNINLGSSTALSGTVAILVPTFNASATTINLGTSAATKTINIGTGGTSSHTTTITIGTSSGTSTIALNGTVSLSSALAVGSGGTGTSTAPTQWGVMFATSTAAIRSTAAGSTNQWLAAVSSGAPVWSTATLATTFTAGAFLYASGANALSGLATTTLSVDTTNIRIGIGTSGASSPLHVLNNGTGTNAVVVMELIDVQSSGTPANGFGGSILFDLESTTTAAQDAASIETVWATATHASRLAELNFKTNDANTSTLTERLSISNITSAQSSTNATVVITGTLGVNSTSYLSSISLNTALAIASGGTNTSSFATTNGLVYFNGTNLLTTNAAASGVLVTNASNVPSVGTDIPTAVTIGGSYVYRAGGTDVPLLDGGTNASLTASAGGIVYSTASAMAINTPGSSGQPLLSGGTGAPTFGTLGMSAGGTGLTTTAPGANFILGMNASNNGLEYKQLVQGSNITITHNANSVTITASGGSATPGGSSTQIQYNNAGALGGIANFTFASNIISINEPSAITTTSTLALQIQNTGSSSVSTTDLFSPALDYVGKLFSSGNKSARIRTEITTNSTTAAHALMFSSSLDTGTASYTKRLSIDTVDGLGYWNYAGTAGTVVNYFKTGNQSTTVKYTWPTAAPSATTQVLGVSTISGSDIALGWVTSSGGGGSGTVSSGTTNQLAYYSGATTTASAPGLVYSASSPHLTITAQGAATTPLKVVGAASQSAAIFTVSTSGGDVFVVGSTGNITTGTWQGTAVGAAYGGTGQTTYTNGQLLIGNTTGNTLSKATLTEGAGIGVTNGAGTITVRAKRILNIVLASGYNPPVGADTAIIRIPESPTDGTTSLTYNLRRLQTRVETASAGTSTFQVEYSTGTGAFSATGLLTTAQSISGTSTYEAFATSSNFATSTFASGTKIRLNFSAVDSTHAYFSINLLLEES